MLIETIAIVDVVEDPANVRRHSAKNLTTIKGSLAKFGQQKPIVVGPGNVVVAGNGTLAAARALGWATIQCVRTELDDVSAFAYSIADNRSGELAEWDEPGLADALRSLQAEDFDLAAIGFNDKDLEKLTHDADHIELDAAAAESNPKLQEFIAARAHSRKRGLDKNETNFWLCLVFQSWAQKHEFLKQIEDVYTLYGMYVDGQTLAERVGIPVTPNREKPFLSKLDKALVSRTLRNSGDSGTMAE